MDENPHTPKEETVTINGKEHNVADLSQEQITFINQVVDLDRKALQINFNLQQTIGARNHFTSLLNESLKSDTIEETK
jgi:hypothetical protein